MSFATTDLQVIPTPALDRDPHPAASHLQDVRTYARALTTYWVDLAAYLEETYTNRATIPVLASVLTIFGAAIIGVNL